MQTPLSDEPADDSVDDEDKDCTDFSELLEDSGTFSDDESAELELGADFAELDKATEQLDCSSIEDTDDEDSSPTAAGEPSDESPHATNANGTANEPASTAQLERDLLFIKNATLLSCPRKRASPFQKALFPNIYQKTQPGEAAFSYLKLRDWSFIYRMQNQVS